MNHLSLLSSGYVSSDTNPTNEESYQQASAWRVYSSINLLHNDPRDTQLLPLSRTILRLRAVRDKS